MPKMGESIMEGTIITWHKQVGDVVEMDETLLEIATDKVDTEVPSPEAGILQEILVSEGETVEVGTVIARIGGSGGSTAAATAPKKPAEKTPESASTPARDSVAASPVSQGDGATMAGGGTVLQPNDGDRFYSPLVRSIAAKEGVSVAELRGIAGSGREGRVTKKDLMAYVATRGTGQPATAKPAAAVPRAPSAPPRRQPSADVSTELTSTLSEDGRVEIVEMDRMRRIIAEHMVASKRTSAHVTSFAEADVTNLVKLRDAEKDAFLEREGIKLTYTPFFVKASVDALREHPLMNASVEGDRILIRKDFHVGIAVAIGKTGLVVPVIRTAGQKNIAGLARDAAVLAERARAKKLQPDDLQGGTFTVTNIGSLGSIMGTPIILQPQVAILATGAIKKRAVVVEDPELGDIIAVRHMMYVSLSYDHRIIDGAMAASFLHHFTQNVQAFKIGIEL
jgi:2-oxoglutarate dehydrogenase E2 component (dihydrolipoamide succinyltransferase)